MIRVALPAALVILLSVQEPLRPGLQKPPGQLVELSKRDWNASKLKTFLEMRGRPVIKKTHYVKRPSIGSEVDVYLASGEHLGTRGLSVRGTAVRAEVHGYADQHAEGVELELDTSGLQPNVDLTATIDRDELDELIAALKAMEPYAAGASKDSEMFYTTSDGSRFTVMSAKVQKRLRIEITDRSGERIAIRMPVERIPAWARRIESLKDSFPAASAWAAK